MKILILLLLSGITTVNALEIAAVDIIRIEEKSKKVNIFRSKIEEKQQKYQVEIKNMEQEIEKETSKLKARASVLSSEQLKNEEVKIQSKIDNFSKEVQSYNMILEYMKNQGITDLNKCMGMAIEHFAKNKNLDLVLTNNSFSYKSQNVRDISDSIIEEMDKSNCDINASKYLKEAEAKFKNK